MSGRNQELREARDQRLFERYYYWTEVVRLRFDDALKKLSEEEFFLSEIRVFQIIREKIREGATVDGKRLESPLFSGFRTRAIKSKKSTKPTRDEIGGCDLFGG